MEIRGAEREQQRFTHLVLGQPRPKPPTPGKRARRKLIAPVRLAPDIDAALRLREDWSHKANGTPETHEYARRQAAREGSLARLVRSGAIDAHQLAAAEEVRQAFEDVVGDVKVRTAKLEPRSGNGRAGEESLAQQLRARAYSRWREAAGAHIAMLLAIIIDDVGLVEAARDARLSNRRAKAVLVDSLDRWRRA